MPFLLLLLSILTYLEKYIEVVLLMVSISKSACLEVQVRPSFWQQYA